MTISRSRGYIATNPRFALTRESTPSLQRGQEAMVYHAFARNPKSCSLEQLAESLAAKKYEQTYKRAVPANEQWLFLRMSILYHLKRMQTKGIVREL